MSGNFISLKKRVSCLLILGMFLLSSLIAGVNIIPYVNSDFGEDYAPMLVSGPVSTITTPHNNTIYPTVNHIYGTAYVAGGGNNTTIVKVEISIKRVSDNRYWDGWNWNTSQWWLTASGTWSWNYYTGSVSWTNAASYVVQSKATDGLARVETPKYGKMFIVNASNPITYITSPSDSYCGTQLLWVAGSAYSFIGNTITKVEISILRENDNHYWTGSGWTNASQPWLTASGNSSWWYNTTSVIWTSSPYLIYARATDNQSKIGSIDYIRIFIDNTMPVSRVSHPLNNSFVKILNQISVIATDGNLSQNISQVKKVQITIKRLSDNRYWSGSTWLTYEIWLNMNVGGNYTHWVYNTRKILWQNNTQYLIRSRATDYFDNLENPGYGNVFNITMDTFYSVIVQLNNNSWQNNVYDIKGYTYFNQSNINITKVEVLLKRTTDSLYWDGARWDMNETWLLANGTSHWLYNFSKVSWINGTRYQVRSRAHDNKANIEPPSFGKYFRIDMTKPTSSITSPTNNSVHTSLFHIHGTMYDTYSGLISIQLMIKQLSDNKTWDGYKWVNNATTWFNTYPYYYYNGTNWFYNTTHITWTNNTKYHIQSRAIDYTGNIETPSFGVVITLLFDTKPVSGIYYPTNNSVNYKIQSINGYSYIPSQYTASITKVEITLKRLSDNTYWDGSGWNSNVTWLMTTGSSNWNYWDYYQNITWYVGSYHLRSRATDNLNNTEYPKFGSVFTVQNGVISHIIQPKNNSTYNGLNNMTGNAYTYYNISYVTKVEIFITRLSDNQIWDGSVWKSNVTWLIATGTNAWYYNVSSVFWTNNTQYIVRSKATDNTSNVQTNLPYVRFIIQFGGGSPYTWLTSLISSPMNNSYLKSLNMVSGSASIISNISSISKVEILIKRISDNKYWNGYSWNSSLNWVTAIGTTSWFYNTTSVSWSSGTSYHVQSRATDSQSNVESPSYGVRFTIDKNKPTTTILWPIDNITAKNLNVINGTSTDTGGSGVKSVELFILRTSDNKYWTGSVWGSSVIWLKATGTSNWDYNTAGVTWTNGGNYLTRARARDYANNLGSASTIYRFTVQWNTSNKLYSTITSPTNNSYLKSLTSITGSAGTSLNNTTISKVEIMISYNNQSWNGVNWTSSKNWLTAMGTTSWSFSTTSISWKIGAWYLVQSRATDSLSNIETPSYGTRFLIDNIKPSSHITIPKHNSSTAAITLIWGGASDSGNSGINYIDITIQRVDTGSYWNGANWVSGTVWLRANGQYSWNYNIGNTSIWMYNRTYHIRSRATDKAGNVEVSSYGNLWTNSIIPSKPGSLINVPTNNSYHNSLTQIRGTAWSNQNYSKLTKIEISIKRLSDNKFWGSSSWTNIVTWHSCSGTTTWSYNSGSVTWTSGIYYVIQSRANDNKSQIETPKYGVKFLFDNNNPSSNITNPLNNAVLGSLNSIVGTASDAGGSNLQYVEIELKRLSDNKYWDGYYWNSTQSWFKVTGTTNWNYNCSKINWINNTQYQLRSRAVDRAQNLEIPSAGLKFTIKYSGGITKQPSSSINQPTNNSIIKSLSFIRGTAVDYSGLGLYKVEITLEDTNTSKYWAGSSWVSTETWLTTIGTTSWLYNTTKINWSTGTYRIRSKAIDNKNNIESPVFGTVFYIDQTKPTSMIMIPVNNLWLKSLDFINGTSKDTNTRSLGSGVMYVEISIFREVNQRYWDGNSWEIQPTWLKATGTTSWSYDCRDVKWYTHNKFIIRSRATDLVGNIENSDEGNMFTYDDVPPKGLFISIENGRKYTNIPFVKIKLKYEDIQARSNTYELSLSFNGYIWSDWESFESEKIIELPEGDGIKYVYFKVRDPAGNIAEPVYASIILDTTPPENLAISINQNRKYTNENELSLILNAVDQISGINNMSFSFDNETWSSWEPFSNTKLITILSGDGEKSIYFRVSDLADNIAEPIMNSIILDTKPPESPSIIINDGDEYTTSEKVELQLNAIDLLSGLSKMSFSYDSITWTSWEPYMNLKNITLPSGEGEKKVYFRVMDKAGNIGEPVMDSIKLKIEVEILDMDNDGTPDQSDAFPTDPAASVDTDSDNYPDIWNPSKTAVDSTTGLHLDAFPTDPAASVDTDKDGYPDFWNEGKSEKDSVLGLKLDAYPNNPKLYLKTSRQDNYDWSFIAIVLIITIMVIIILLFIVFRNNRQRGEKEYQYDKILMKIKNDILNEAETRTIHITNEELIKRIDESYKRGEISSEVYDELKNAFQK